MKIYVALANPIHDFHNAGWLDVFCQLAINDRWGRHKIVSSPDSADCILFIDAHVSLSIDYYRIVDDHPLTKRFPEKVMVYDEYDRPPCYGRGIYVSIPKGLLKPDRHAVVCYWHNDFDYLSSEKRESQRSEYCFFAGAILYNPTRSRIVNELNDSSVTILDNSAYSLWKSGPGAPAAETLKESRERYSDLMLRHQYCLAPRGKGASSMRLFEAISHSTIPIVLSDEYVNPNIPNWHAAVVTFPQRKPQNVIRSKDILQEQFRSRQLYVSELSRNYFGPDSRWNFYGDQLESLLNKGGTWVTRTHAESRRTRLYWFYHRLLKKIEGLIVDRRR